VKGLNVHKFQGAFTISFRLNIDSSVVVGLSSKITILSIIGPKSRLSICIHNGVLYVTYDSKASRVLVSVCNRMLPNVWSHFIICFPPTIPHERMTIVTYRDMDRLADSDFAAIDFEPGPIDIEFGGFTGPKSTPGNEIVGQVADIFVYGRKFKVPDAITLAYDPIKRPEGEL
jgi:hypothetical protein